MCFCLEKAGPQGPKALQQDPTQFDMSLPFSLRLWSHALANCGIKISKRTSTNTGAIVFKFLFLKLKPLLFITFMQKFVIFTYSRNSSSKPRISSFWIHGTEENGTAGDSMFAAKPLPQQLVQGSIAGQDHGAAHLKIPHKRQVVCEENCFFQSRDWQCKKKIKYNKHIHNYINK